MIPDRYRKVEPITNRAREIRQEITPQKIVAKIDGEPIVNGTFESNYDRFRIERKRKGEDFSISAYYNTKLDELERLEEGVLSLEKWLERDGYAIQFHAAASTIRGLQRDVQLLIDRQKENQPKKIRTKTHYTYKWKASPTLKEHFRKMVTKEFLDKSVPPKVFEDIFFNGVDSEGIKPVVWKSENATELKYFIKKLEESGLIESSKRMDYERLKRCFVKSDNSPFNSNFKNININDDSNLGGDTRKRVDEIFLTIGS